MSQGLRRAVDSRLGPFLFALAVLLGAASPSWAQLITLNAHPGPSNNGGLTGWGIFFDVSSSGPPVTIEQMTTASTAAANATYTVEVFRRAGTALGGPVTTGPGSSPAGWTSLGTATATQGPTANGVSQPIDIPNIPLFPAGQIIGVAVVFTGAGPRYFGLGSPPYGTYSDAAVTLVTGDVRSMPFTPNGSWFASRELVGAIIYSIFPVELMSFEVQ